MTLDHVPFAKLLAIEVDSAEPGHAVLSIKLQHEHMRNDAIAHGGVIATLIDSAMAIAIMAMLDEGERTVTASARVVRAGRRVITVSAELFDSEGKLAATAISTYLRSGSN